MRKINHVSRAARAVAPGLGATLAPTLAQTLAPTLATKLAPVLALAMMLAGSGAAPALAQSSGGTVSNQPGDFTFRRVVAPPKGAAPKITIQIDPEEQAAAMRAAAWGPPQGPEVAEDAAGGAVQPAPAPVSTVWDWFWDEVSPAESGAGPANVARALAALEANRDAPQPRLQPLADIVKLYGKDILVATLDTKVSPALVLALISVESSGQAGATSGAGARGLMQLIPDTAARFGVEDIADPVQNINGGVAYLDWLLEKFERDPILALAGYNAGENAVTRAGGVPDFAETRAYVPKVLSAWRVARGLCMTPPQLIGDGCVFAVQG